MTLPAADLAPPRRKGWIDLLSRIARAEEGRLRLSTLNALRWLGLTGQLVAVLFVHFSLGFETPLFECLLAIGAGAMFTVGLTLAFPANHRPSDPEALAYLVIDQTQISAVLFLTGGLDNPFVLVLLAGVVIASSSLNLRYALALGGYTLMLITGLAIFHVALPWEAGEALSLPPIYVAGEWIALMLSLGFTTVVTFRVSSEATRQQAGYAAMELALASEQKLAALGSLAAAAAHELGTPLGTIAVVAKELERELPKGGHLAEDAKLLREQVDRCRDILRRLADHRESDGIGPDARLPLLAFLDDLAQHHRTLRVQVVIEGAEDSPVIRVLPELRYAIGNLIENAVDFAERQVKVTAKWDDARIVVRVRDDGPGFAYDVLARLGEPYVTTRPGRAALTDEQLGPRQPGKAATHDGMGLGFFIAKTLLERSGAEMTFGNAFDGGASVTMAWPRSRIEAPELAGR
jgi:two-component system sensor histidine kinase RegB